MPIAVPAERSPRTPAADAPIIVVGYDGSDEARIAVAVAAERAGPLGTVVPVHVMPSASGWLGAPYYDREVVAGHQAGQALLVPIDEIDTGATVVEPELIEGDPAETPLLGSVSPALLQDADRPVVIVPRGALDGEH